MHICAQRVVFMGYMELLGMERFIKRKKCTRICQVEIHDQWTSVSCGRTTPREICHSCLVPTVKQWRNPMGKKEVLAPLLFISAFVSAQSE